MLVIALVVVCSEFLMEAFYGGCSEADGKHGFVQASFISAM